MSDLSQAWMDYKDYWIHRYFMNQDSNKLPTNIKEEILNIFNNENKI